MNIFEMHIGVNLGVQKIASHINGDLLPEEIDYYLNNSITEYVKQQYSIIKNINRDVQSQYVHENLRKLLKTVDLEDFTDSDYLPNTKEALLPSDYKYYISSFSFVDSIRKTNAFVQPQTLHKYIRTDSNSPIFRQNPVYIENNKIALILEDIAETVKIVLTYISVAPKLKLVLNQDGSYNNTNSTQPTFLPDHTHKEIVDMTIQTILKDLTQFKGQE
jgi:hypothetical protein